MKNYLKKDYESFQATLRQFETAEECQQYIETKEWLQWDDEKQFLIQLGTSRLFLSWDRFCQLANKILQRSVYTHEFAYPELLYAEAKKIIPAANLNDIMDKMPKDKSILIMDTTIQSEK